MATTRTLPAIPDAGGMPGRSPIATFAEYTFPVPARISPMNDRAQSNSSFLPDEIDPGEARILDPRTFTARMAAGQSGKKPRIGVFIHGYNTTYEESLAHVAKMAAAADGALTPVLFSWPSAGRATGYVADRDAAAYSRDALSRLLADLTANSRIGEVTVFAHSMGAWLVVEALRQMRIERAAGEFDRLRVILAAPDIDIDLFRVQIDRIGKLPNPVIVLVSPDDRILRLSARIAGDRRRVGSLSADDPRVIAGARKAGLIVVDISDAKSTNLLNHDKYIEIAERYRRLSKPDGDILQRAGNYVFIPASGRIVPRD